MIPAGSPSPMSHEPRPTATAPARMKSGAVSTVTPPVGSSGMCGNGPRNSRTNAGPATEAGKSFTAEAPARQAARISVGVNAPGRNGIPRSTAHSISSGSTCGDTRKVAPASMARSAASSLSTVPAPISSAVPSAWRAAAPSTSSACSSGSLSVSSKARTPPRSRPSATSGTFSAVRFRAIATTPPSRSPAGIGGRASVTAGRGRDRAPRRAHAASPAKPRGPSARTRSPARATGGPPGRARGPGRSARRRRTRFRRTSS